MDADVRLLHDLVAIPSPTGSADKAVRFLVDAMRARGFDAHVDAAGNAVGTLGRGRVEVLLCGHADTVPGDLPVRLADGVLHGRGAVDAKGPLACFVAAATRLADDPRLKVTVAGVPDEEGASDGARHLARSRGAPTAVVIGEPSGVSGVTVGYKGIVKLRWTLEDDLHHSGMPMPSVPDRAMLFWHLVRAYCVEHRGPTLFESASPTLTDVRTTHLPNGRVRAELAGNVRTPPGFDREAFLAKVREAAGDGVLEEPECADAWVDDRASPLVRAFTGAVRSEGLAPRLLRKTGTSDMNVLAPAWRVPCVAYGPGDSGLDHTPHERVDVAEYLRAIDVLERALRAFPDRLAESR